MPLSLSQKAALDNLIAQGELDSAAKFLAELDAAGAGAPKPGAAPAPAPAPRAFDVIVFDAFTVFHSLLGNNPAANDIMTELRDVIGLEDPHKPPPQ